MTDMTDVHNAAIGLKRQALIIIHGFGRHKNHTPIAIPPFYQS